jgi:hypothetical protein
MENQHRLIKGYRDLSETEIAAINRVKEIAEQIGTEVEGLFEIPGIDKRWLSIGKTHLQQGFMAVIRSVAKPDTF